MFLSKKLLMASWTPFIQEIYSTASSTASSSTLRGAYPVYTGTNKIYFNWYSGYIRYIDITNPSAAASTQTDVMIGTSLSFVEGISTSSNYVYYACRRLGDNMEFSSLNIDTSTDVGTPTVVTHAWSHYNNNLCLGATSNGDVWWATNTPSTPTTTAFKYNNNTIATFTGVAGIVGQPAPDYTYAKLGSGVYTVTSSNATLLCDFSGGGTPQYVNGAFFVKALTTELRLSRYDLAGTLLWQKDFYADENQLVRVKGRLVGRIGNKIYCVTFPTSSDPTSVYYKLMLIEIDLETGETLNSYQLPTPKSVTNGVITLDNVFSGSGDASLKLECKNRRMSLPIVCGYTQNSVFYHNWFVITIPE